jgi:hypothetical protein
VNVQIERRNLCVETTHDDETITKFFVTKNRKGQAEATRPQFIGGRPSPATKIVRVKLSLETRKGAERSVAEIPVEPGVWDEICREEDLNRVYLQVIEHGVKAEVLKARLAA